MASKAVEYGGHDYKFVSKVPDRFICQICTKVLRDPHLAVCCGQHFCESCLNKWFTRQGKESCPHCRAEGEAFNHVIHKGLRSEVNQLKIRCSNYGKGCVWKGELGALKKHLESDNGCGYVLVDCPNKCRENFRLYTTMNRKDLEIHLDKQCYLRPYQCEFCGHKDTYEAITGKIPFLFYDNPYGGHQAECPEVPLTCPNKCGSDKIKRKDMKNHRSQCPQESMKCPFAEAGCSVTLKRCELDTHVASSQQEHLSLMMKDYQDTKRELHEVKGTLFTAIHLLKQGTKADKEMVDEVIFNSMQLVKIGDSVDVLMPKFTEHLHNGKIWYSLPFYYRGRYKMCLAVYANGVEEGAGTHVSVTLVLFKGKHENVEHQQELKQCSTCIQVHLLPPLPEGQGWFNVCQYRPLCQYFEAVKELSHEENFCTHRHVVSKLVNDCVTFNVKYCSDCYLLVSMKYM